MHRENVISEIAERIESALAVDSEYVNIPLDLLQYALALLKEQEEQKRKWLQTIADTQLAVSPTGYETEAELAKRTGEWNGLQMAWEIITGEERSEHPRLVRCKDCKWRGHEDDSPKWIPCLAIRTGAKWFCADGENASYYSDESKTGGQNNDRI